MAWTNEQKEAIYTEGTNIIVSAGAGSGKTAVLTERVLEKVKKGISVDNLLILTFTKMAAKEMKERIGDKLKKEGLTSELAKLDTADITTFDAYALSVVKKYHYYLNVSKDINIIDGSVITLYKRKILKDIFEELYEENNHEFIDFIQEYCIKDDKDIFEFILNINSKLDLKTNKREYLDNYINTVYDEVKIDNDIDNYIKVILKLISNINDYLEYIDDDDYLAKLYDVISPLLSAKSYDDIKSNISIKLPILRGASDITREYRDKIKSTIDEIKKLTTYDSYDDIKRGILSTKGNAKVIIDIIKKLDDITYNYKVKYNSYEYSDISALAIKLVRDNKEIREEIKNNLNEILIDEYQDTSPLVIEILLNFLQTRKKKNIIGFFGDSMQSIYETGVGDIDRYIEQCIVVKVIKEQNRRNPQSVIDIANALRTDGLIQQPSDDISAPNMENGVVKQGTVKFAYSKSFDLKKVKSSILVQGWDFTNAKETKELRLTHNLIANEAGFSQLMEIYDNDPIAAFKKAFKEEAKKQGIQIPNDVPFEDAVGLLNWTYKRGPNKGKSHLDVLLEVPSNKMLFEHIKRWPYEKVQKIYLDKDSLIDDKVVIDGVTIKEPKRDRLIQHLFKIQELISLYESKQYNELIRMTSFRVQSVADKVKLKTAIEHLKAQNGASIATVISYAHKEGLCIIDDKLQEFIDNNEYLYWRVSDIAFVEVQNLYKYIEGHMPFSTQHKIKGLEFKNVLIVLHNGGWNNYNFEYLFNRNVGAMLTPAQKRSYPNILRRTQKLFYVCCTRAKDNLVVYYPSPSDEVLEGAVSLFGRDNCIDLDAE